MMKFSPPIELIAVYRITTPMFLGGFDQEPDDKRFRNSSLKGALRFWWRALNWSQILREAGNVQESALKALHHKEGELFGRASDGEYSQQSKVRLSTTLHDVIMQKQTPELKSLSYLLGQGLFNFRDGVKRNFLSNGTLRLTLTFRPGCPAEDVASVRQAAIALGILGGLGSRARKGFGSLSIQSLIEPDQPNRNYTTLPDIKAFLENLDLNASLPPFSALSQASRVDVSATGTSASGVLTSIGEEMQMYRSFGKDGKVNGKAARRNFPDDHDNVLSAAQGQSIHKLPRRIAFGLPHNYFFSSIKSGVNIAPENGGRRASPLFIHVHALEDKRFIAIQTLLPATFLPSAMKIEIKPNGSRPRLLSDNTIDYQVIHQYLDGFEDKEVLLRGK